MKQQYGQRTKQGSRCQADEEGRCKACGQFRASARETGVCMWCQLQVRIASWQLEAMRHA